MAETYTAVLTLRLPDGCVVTVQDTWVDVVNADALEFYYTDGNGACDCSLADLVRNQVDATFPQLPCGDSQIERVALEITTVRETP